MKTIIRNILAVILGLVVGSTVNMTLIMISPHVIPLPEGVDVTKPETFRASAHLFEPKHFVFPFLAHALGTLVGALVAFVIAASYRSVFACIIGAFFLLGGITMAIIMPVRPVWFILLDVVVAYIPMAWSGIHIGRRLTKT